MQDLICIRVCVAVYSRMSAVCGRRRQNREGQAVSDAVVDCRDGDVVEVQYVR